MCSSDLLDDFDFAAHKDLYVLNLKKLIQMKIDGEEVVQVPELEAPKIINLMEALKKSVAEAQATAQGKKMAPSAKSPATAKKKTSRKKSG